MFALCKRMMKAPDFNKRDNLQHEVFAVSKALREQIRDANASDWRINLASLTYKRPDQEDHSNEGGPATSEGGASHNLRGVEAVSAEYRSYP